MCSLHLLNFCFRLVGNAVLSTFSTFATYVFVIVSEGRLSAPFPSICSVQDFDGSAIFTIQPLKQLYNVIGARSYLINYYYLPHIGARTRLGMYGALQHGHEGCNTLEVSWVQ